MSEYGDRVFLSPHLRGDVPDREPPQILIGLTGNGADAGGAGAAGSAGATACSPKWRTGRRPASRHSLMGSTTKRRPSWIGLAKLIVPFGGLQRCGLRGGQTIIINGATGYFGSGAVMLAVAMGAATRGSRSGRKQAALEALRETLWPARHSGGRHAAMRQSDLADHPPCRRRQRRRRTRPARCRQEHVDHAVQSWRALQAWLAGWC